MNRISPRERFLIGLLGGALFLLGNWALWGSVAGQYRRLKSDISVQQSDIRSMQKMIAEGAETAARDAWIHATQPKLTNPEQAGVQLLDQVKETARASEVLLEAPELGSVETQPLYRSVTVQVRVKSSWPNLIKLLHALQAPERFVALDSATLQVDPANPKQMTCQLKIAKWYAR